MIKVIVVVIVTMMLCWEEKCEYYYEQISFAGFAFWFLFLL
jgi:hypothetical protein